MRTANLKEWIGKNDDSRIPDYVRLRVFDRHRGICHLSGIKITASDAWDLDHIVALCNGGEHRETNLAPALRDKHRDKTAADVSERARVDRKRKHHLGIKSPKRKIPSRGFAKAPGQKRASSPIAKWKGYE